MDVLPVRPRSMATGEGNGAVSWMHAGYGRIGERASVL